MGMWEDGMRWEDEDGSGKEGLWMGWVRLSETKKVRQAGQMASHRSSGTGSAQP